MSDRENSWHLSKSVPVAMLLAIALNAGLTIRWGARVESAVETHENRLNRHETIIETMRGTANEQAVTLGRIEEVSLSTLRMVERLTRQIESATDGRAR